jgi:hypothetical protein
MVNLMDGQLIPSHSQLTTLQTLLSCDETSIMDKYAVEIEWTKTGVAQHISSRSTGTPKISRYAWFESPHAIEKNWIQG